MNGLWEDTALICKCRTLGLQNRRVFQMWEVTARIKKLRKNPSFQGSFFCQSSTRHHPMLARRVSRIICALPGQSNNHLISLCPLLGEVQSFFARPSANIIKICRNKSNMEHPVTLLPAPTRHLLTTLPCYLVILVFAWCLFCSACVCLACVSDTAIKAGNHKIVRIDWAREGSFWKICATFS